MSDLAKPITKRAALIATTLEWLINWISGLIRLGLLPADEKYLSELLSCGYLLLGRIFNHPHKLLNNFLGSFAFTNS